MPDFTVVLRYPDYFTDTDGPHVAHVEAENYEAAIRAAQEAVAVENEGSGAAPSEYELAFWIEEGPKEPGYTTYEVKGKLGITTFAG